MTDQANEEGWLRAWSALTSAGDDTGPLLRPVRLHGRRQSPAGASDHPPRRGGLLSTGELHQRQQAQADLLQAARPHMEYLSRLLAGTPHVVALAGRAGYLLALRGTPERFGGAAAGLALGANWADAEAAASGVSLALVTGEPTLVYEAADATAHQPPVACLGVPIRDGEAIIGVLAVRTFCQDADPARLTFAQACVASIESVVQARRQPVVSSSGAEQAIVQQMLATVLHDLKAPLTAMSTTGQLGTRLAPNDQLRHYFQTIVKQVDRLVEMLNTLAQTQEVEAPVLASPAAILADIASEVGPLCQAAGITIILELDEQARALLRPILFRRAAQNLISNAIQAMPAGGTLSLWVLKQGDRVLVTVTDTGRGIPPEVQATIFTPYVHGRTDGTGLGLYVVHQAITVWHGGRVWFETQPGRGTTFFIELPAGHPSASTG